jgi:hypothetical protein
VKIEFDFDASEANVTPMEGVAVLYCYDSAGDPILIYGTYNEPTSLAAIGLHTMGLELAKGEMLDAPEYEEDDG